MKNQRMKQGCFLRRMGAMLASLCLLAIAICGLMTVSFAYAAGTDGIVQSVSFDISSGIAYDSEGKYWKKTYDGDSAIEAEAVTLSVVGQTEELLPVVKSACFTAVDSFEAKADVGDARIYIVYEWDGVEKEYVAPAKIEARHLSWGNVSLNAHLTYAPEKNVYHYAFSEAELSRVKISSLVGVVASDAEKLSLETVASLSVGAADVLESLTSGKALRRYTSAKLSGEAASNYVLAGIEVQVQVAPCKITEVIWELDGAALEETTTFSYGDGKAYEIVALGKVGEDSYCDLTVKVKDTDLTLLQATPTVYGAVREEPYVLVAESANPTLFVLDGAHETAVMFERAECVISAADVIFRQDVENNSEFYYLPIQNPDDNVPASVFARVGCKYTLDGVNFVNMPSEPGVYTVQFFLHPDDEANYTLKVEESGENADGIVTATLLPYRLYAGIEENGSDVIVYNDQGDLLGIQASVALAKNIPSGLLKYFSVYRGITLSLTGTEKTDSFRLLIPVHSDLFGDPNTYSLTDADLYVLSGESLKRAKDAYTVSLSEDGSYYTVSGVAARGAELSLTFVLAPAYRVSFWATAPGVATIAFLILLALVLLALLGLYLRRREKSEKNPVLTIDPDGDPKTVSEKPESVVGSADACINEGLDAYAKELEKTTEPEAAPEAPADAIETAEAATELRGKTLTEAAVTSLGQDEGEAIKEAEKITEAMAEEKAKDFYGNVEPETALESEEDIDRVEQSVADAISEAVDAARAADADSATEKETPHVSRQTIDAIVVEALAAVVQLPAGASELESDASEEVGDPHLLIERSVEDALRVISADGAALALNEGVTADTVVRAIADAAVSCAPDDWSAELSEQVTSKLTEVLVARLFK